MFLYRGVRFLGDVLQEFLSNISLGVISGIGKGIIGMDPSFSASTGLTDCVSLFHRSVVEDDRFKGLVDQGRPLHERRCWDYGTYRARGSVRAG